MNHNDVINSVQLHGNLTADPEVKTLSDGKKVANFTVVTNEAYKDKTTGERKETPYFHSITAWGKQAEKTEAKLKTGTEVIINGPLRSNVKSSSGDKNYYNTYVEAKVIRTIKRSKE